MKQLLFMKSIKPFLLLLALIAATTTSFAQASYIVEQLGRDQNHIVQSLGAFVGNENAESQAFDITFMPGQQAEGVLIINTADYRCTFKLNPEYDVCYEVLLDVRSAAFLHEFNQLFQFYRTEVGPDGNKLLYFGDKVVTVSETSSPTSRFRAFTLRVAGN